MKTNSVRALLRPLTRGVVSLSMATIGAASWAQSYSLTELPMLDGFANIHATGLNASGQVIGLGYNGDPLGSGGGQYSVSGQGLAFVTGAAGQGIQAIAPLAGKAWSRAAAINDAGQVVGSSGNTSYNDMQAFIADGAAMSARAIPGLVGQYSSATAINASGQVVGYVSEQNVARAFLSAPNGGTASRLTLPPGEWGDEQAYDVTDDGRVLGSYDIFSFTSKGYLTGPQGANAQGLPNQDPQTSYASSIRPLAINDAGQIMGVYGRSGGGVFLRQADGSERLLDFSTAPHYVPGNTGSHGQYGPRTSTVGSALNAAGQVVGAIVSNDLYNLGVSKGYITGPNGEGVMQLDDLTFSNVAGPLGFYFTSVTGINDLGSFVANGSNGKAYLISVVPEPASYATMLAGLALMSLAVRRRGRTS